MVFFSGIILGICLSVTYNIASTQSGNMDAVRMTDLYCLRLLSVSLEEVMHIRHTKHRIMREFKTHTPGHLKMVKNQDEHNVDRWKREVIEKLTSRFPKSYRGSLKYHDWDTAMYWLGKEMRKNIDIQK